MRSFDWPEKLVVFISERERRAFEWGKRNHDCGSFGAAWAHLATGIDPMETIPDYNSEAEAAAILAATPFEVMLDARFQRWPAPSFAQRGDLGLAEIDGQDTLMIVLGDDIVGPGKRRLARLPRTMMWAAWAV